MPVELFPTRYRSTAYGIAMAVGKFSYVLSYVILDWIYSVENFHARFLGAAVGWAAFLLLGAVCTTFLPETKHKSLEEIADDVSSKDS